MELSLTKKLVDKKLLNENTEVLARYDGKGVNCILGVQSTGIFNIVQVIYNSVEDTYLFDVYSTLDGSHRRIKHSDIIEIDGMTPKRFASVYDIKADGSAELVGKRRGRKPKNRNLNLDAI
jgi:hypothetical protein